MRQTDSGPERVLTEDRDAEREVIGSVIADPDLMRVAQSVNASDFTMAEHRTIWRAILRLMDDGQALTSRAVRALAGDEISRLSADYLTQLADDASAAHGVLGTAVERLLDASRRRKVDERLAEMRREVTRSEEPLQIIIARGASRIDRAALGDETGFMTAGEAAARLERKLEQPSPRIPTGIPKLDAVLNGGLPPEKMMAVNSRSKVGKTTFVATLSHNLSAQAVPHLILSLERSGTDLEQMIMARSLQTSAVRLERDYQSYRDDFRKLRAVREASGCYYQHNPGASLDQIRQAILRAHRLYGIRLFALDYFQLVAKPPRESTVDHLTQVAQSLADLTAALGIASVVTAQTDAEGLMPRDCKVLWHSAAINFVIRRADDQPETWLENIGSNAIEPINVGAPNSPAMMFDGTVGPHFRAI